MDVAKANFQKYYRFEVRSWKVRFDFENTNPGSVGSRFDFLEVLRFEVQRFEVRNFPVRPKTSVEHLQLSFVSPFFDWVIPDSITNPQPQRLLVKSQKIFRLQYTTTI